MTTTNKTASKAAPKESKKKVTVEEAQEAVAVDEVQAIQLSPEQVEADRKTLEEGIALALEQFEFGKDEESFNGMTEKEQTYTRLLDPMIWIMRESLITYEHEDCDECKVRRESGGNGLAVAIGAMILGRL